MRQIKAIRGATGGVGSTYIESTALHHLPENGKERHPSVPVILWNNTEMMINEAGFKQNALITLSNQIKQYDEQGIPKEQRRRMSEIIHGYGQVIENPTDDQVLDAISSHGWADEIVIVDASGVKELGFHRKAMDEVGARINTANKNEISLGSTEDYRYLTQNPGSYQYDATVGAGLGAGKFIKEHLAIHDHLQRLDATLSGTLQYLDASLLKGGRLTDVIIEAAKAQYTEPDWRDDLNGVDVARKLIIIARDAGFDVEIGDIEIEPYIPEKYFAIEDAGERIEAMKADKCDDIMAERLAKVGENGETLKYMGVLISNGNGSKPTLKVGFFPVSLESDFARAKGTKNIIQITTDKYHADQPKTISGPGAGKEVTESALRVGDSRILQAVRRQYGNLGFGKSI